MSNYIEQLECQHSKPPPAILPPISTPIISELNKLREMLASPAHTMRSVWHGRQPLSGGQPAAMVTKVRGNMGAYVSNARTMAAHARLYNPRMRIKIQPEGRCCVIRSSVVLTRLPGCHGDATQ